MGKSLSHLPAPDPTFVPLQECCSALRSLLPTLLCTTTGEGSLQPRSVPLFSVCWPCGTRMLVMGPWGGGA